MAIMREPQKGYYKREYAETTSTQGTSTIGGGGINLSIKANTPKPTKYEVIFAELEKQSAEIAENKRQLERFATMVFVLFGMMAGILLFSLI